MVDIKQISKDIRERDNADQTPESIFRNQYQSWWWINHSRYDQKVDSTGHVTIKYTYADLRDYFFEEIWKKQKWVNTMAKQYNWPKDHINRVQKYIELVKKEGRTM